MAEEKKNIVPNSSLNVKPSEIADLSGVRGGVAPSFKPFSLKVFLLPHPEDEDAYAKANMKIDQELKFTVATNDCQDLDTTRELEMLSNLRSTSNMPYQYKKVTLMIDPMPIPWVTKGQDKNPLGKLKDTMINLPVMLLDRGCVKIQMRELVLPPVNKKKTTKTTAAVAASESAKIRYIVMDQALSGPMTYVLLPKFFKPHQVSRYWKEDESPLSSVEEKRDVKETKDKAKRVLESSASLYAIRSIARQPKLTGIPVSDDSKLKFEPFKTYTTSRTADEIASEKLVFADMDIPLTSGVLDHEPSKQSRQLLSKTSNGQYAVILNIQKIINAETQEPATYFVNRVYAVTAIRLYLGY